MICAKSPASRSLGRARVHRRFVPHPSVCFLHVVFSLFSQQPMMSLQLCSSSPRNPEAFRRLFRRVLTDVCSEVCSIVDSRFSFFFLALPPLLLHPRLAGGVGGVEGCGVAGGATQWTGCQFIAGQHRKTLAPTLMLNTNVAYCLVLIPLHERGATSESLARWSFSPSHQQKFASVFTSHLYDVKANRPLWILMPDDHWLADADFGTER